MATAAKLPAATLAQVDVGGEMAGIVTATLSGAHNNSVTTITLTATVPASWPTAGWVTIDSEIIQYVGKSGSTLTGCTRGTQTAYGAGAAASHSDQATVGLYVTPQAWDQVVADLIETQVLMVKGVDIASATTLVPGTDGSYFHVTGTTTITAITPSPAWKAGLVLRLEFDGALTLTHNATSLILKGAANYTTTAGDVLTFVSEGSGNWRETVRSVGPLLDRIAADTTVANTVTETDLYRKTVLANTLGATGGLRLTLIGDRINNSVGAATIRFRIKFGATTLFDTNTTNFAQEATRHGWKMVVEILNSATGAQRSGAVITFENTGATVFQLTASTPIAVGYATAAEDTTASKDIAVTVQHGTAATTIDAVARVALLERF